MEACVDVALRKVCGHKIQFWDFVVVLLLVLFVLGGRRRRRLLKRWQ